MSLIQKGEALQNAVNRIEKLLDEHGILLRDNNAIGDLGYILEQLDKVNE